jgi:DNA-binding MarR family transcriptional regulator
VTSEAKRLRTSVHAFVRSFGLLASDRTPCGSAIPLSCAYALVHLLGDSEPTQQQLGDVLHIDKSNVARLCAKMEAEGWIVQRRAEHDGRVRLLSLTAKGRRVAEKVETNSRARFERLLAAVPPHEREVLLPALESLAKAAATLDEEQA